MKKILCLLLVTALSFAQNANRKYISNTYENGVLNVKTSDGHYEIFFMNNATLQCSFIPNGEEYKDNSHVITTKKTIGHYGGVAFSDEENQINMPNEEISLQIIKSPFQIIYYGNNRVLFSEKEGYVKKDSTEAIRFNLNPDEVLYGGGARALGMNRRGNRLQLYNRAHYGYETHAELMNFCIPMVLSSNRYAIHFDNPSIGYLDLDSKKDNTLEYETISGRKTYQVFTGYSWNDIISNLSEFTGKQPLPPRWAFGNFSSRFGYHSQDEVEKTIQKFQENKIPVDAIILDLYWFGKEVKGTMGNLDWDKDNFPNPTKMISNLNKKGVKTVLITEPFILTTSSKWQDAVDNNILAITKDGKPATWDFYFGNTGIVDIFKPQGKEWFWNVYKRLIKQGVGGLWGYLGEPEVFPSKVITAGGKADEIHNVYGHNWAKLIAEGYQKDFPNQRPFILMRAGYSGSQKYGMIPWSGDVNRSWGGLQSQMEIALQMGMQGVGYMHSDLGGFAGANLDDELYVRWLQYGVFNPVFRPHAQEEVASEAINRSDKVKELAKKAIELRYQMLPYNYNTAFQNSQTGMPLMRPLFFDELFNKSLFSNCENYLWGNDFLIAPITKKGQETVEVYFPKTGIHNLEIPWYDFYTNQRYEAGKKYTINTVADHIPTFVRGNAIIPLIKTIQNTKNYSLKEFELHHYSGASFSDFQLYNDNGVTANAFEKGKYEKFHFTLEHEGDAIEFKIEREIGKKYKSDAEIIHLIIHNNYNFTPTKIILFNKELPFEWNSKSKELNITIPISKIKKTATINIK
jgi:oligosaccharide 4-alpha-D-glucosyltransferase